MQDPSVIEVHTAVPGRARLKILGLQGRRALKDALETQLAGRAGIRSVSANAVTGNVLIFYDSNRRLGEIVGRLEIVVRSPLPKSPPPRESKTSAPGIVRKLLDAFERKRGGKPQVAAPRSSIDWHKEPASDVLRVLNAGPGGLTTQEATARLALFGSNSLTAPERRSAVALFLEQLQSLPVLLLMGSAVLSVATGGVADAVVITAVVMLNAGIGCAMELQAERTIQTLLRMGEPRAIVLRDGAARQILPESVVPGDVLVIRAGDPIAADARLLTASNLTVDESALTGESVPVEKTDEVIEAEVLADRVNMVYRGTAPTGGSGLAVAVATGAHTEIGRIQSLMSEAGQPQTPLQRQLAHIGGQLVWVTGAVAGSVFVLGLLRGFSAVEMLKSAVSLAVAAVPEGLPTVATVALANGVGCLLKRKVVVRRLQAVEALGSVDVLCFDKTGTLTLNQMAVAAVYAGRRRYEAASGTLSVGSPEPEFLRLLEVCSLCTEAEPGSGALDVSGTPTEAALLRLAMQSGVDVSALRRRFPLQTIVHRSRARNYMLSRHAAPGESTFIGVKGSPSEVLALCSHEARGGDPEPLTEIRRRAILKENERMAGEALRVLGVAFGEGELGERELVWAGLAGIADPPREGLAALLHEFRHAGIRPVMITGDQAGTATAIGQAVRLNGSRPLDAINAGDLANLHDEELGRRVMNAHIFSRVSPAQKLQVVRAFQREGKIVAMTGDGINDGPALKAADVGVALGRGGTTVAREVADVVLTDDNIHAMIHAVREGRRVHENIRKAIHYISATNASEVLLMVSGIAAGLGQPLNARQLLWINLLTDVFPEIALALGPARPDAMREPPVDADRPLVGGREYRALGTQAVTMTGAALGAYAYGLSRYGVGAKASSMAFCP